MQSNIVTILSNERIAPSIYKMTVSAHPTARCGQFYMLRREDGTVLLPRPISICDQLDGKLVFLYQLVGKGTAGFAALLPGDTMRLTGPLGNGFDLDALRGRIALVGGGIGIAPMLLTAKALREKGMSADCFCGFRDEAYLTDELAPHVQALNIATETGRTGHKGYVTELLAPEQYSTVLCCGPMPMMKETVRLCAAADTTVYVSLENRMACGIGGCLVCTCTDKHGKNRRTCMDGPVFRGEEVDFDA